MRLLREPLLHFFLLGALIFAAFALGGGRNGAPAERIVVSAGRIDQLAAGFTRIWQRPPTATELRGLIDQYVRDEVYYREALALGLERDDDVVRRRLREKMEFLVEDLPTGPAPSDAALQHHLDAHPDAFRVDGEVTLRQVYVSRDQRGVRADADARALLARLAAAGPEAAGDDLGDASMLPSEVTEAPLAEVARIFGDDFATALAALPLGSWAGPVESGYGLHLVLLRARTESRVPALAEVRDAVALAVVAEDRKRMVDRAYAGLRARYQIVVEQDAAGKEAVARK